MNCVEFKRIVLGDPNSRDGYLLEHSKACQDCRHYHAEVKQTDVDLKNSIDAAIPDDLVARLQLNQELSEANSFWSKQKIAMAASMALVFVMAVVLIKQQMNLSNQVQQDHQALVAEVSEHLTGEKMTPVWESARANQTAQVLLASYDPSVAIKPIKSLNFARICPMGKYRGLHATLDTPDGQVSFAYIKGQPESDLIDTNYQGHMVRVKPVAGGNLVIIGNNARALQQADRDIQQSLSWDI